MALRTNANLLADVLFRSREPTDGSSVFKPQALNYLNRAYRALWTGGAELNPTVNEQWWWMQDENGGVIQLDPIISTLQVTTTDDSENITFSSAPNPEVDNDVAGWFLKIEEDPNVYRIRTNSGGGTAAVIDQDYRRGSATKNCWLFRTDYDLDSDVMELTGPFQVHDRTFSNSQGLVYQIDLEDMNYRYPREQVWSGPPQFFSLKGAGDMRVRFSHCPAEKSISLVYNYIAYPDDIANDSSECLVPLEHRHILTDYATGLLLADKNDERSQTMIQMAQSGLVAMARLNGSRTGRQLQTRLVRPRLGRRHRDHERGGPYWWGW